MEKECILIVSYHCFLGLWCYKDWMSAHSWTRNTRNSSREPKKSWRQTPTRNSLSSGKTSLIYSIANSWNMEGVTSADGQSGGQLVCWWTVVSKTSPTVFTSFKWNLPHMITMTCLYECHSISEARSKGSRVMPLFSIFSFHQNPYFWWQSRDRGFTLSLQSVIAHLVSIDGSNGLFWKWDQC